MFPNVPLHYLIFANVPICAVGMAMTILKAPPRYAVPMALFQIAFEIVLISRATLAWKAVRAKTRVPSTDQSS